MKIEELIVAGKGESAWSVDVTASTPLLPFGRASERECLHHKMFEAHHKFGFDGRSPEVDGREWRVASLISQGIEYREIAEELGIAKRTVKAIVHRVAERERYRGKRLDVFMVWAVCGQRICEKRLRIVPVKKRQMVRMVVYGRTNGEIAEDLGWTVSKVTNQMRGVFDQVGAWKRAELVRFLVR